MTDCASIAKRHVKTLSSNAIKALQKSDLSEIEYWILYYAYVEKRLVANICMRLHISEAQYYIHLLVALTKAYYILHL